MRNDEQLRRRNPKAHTAMILGRRERDARQIRQHAPSHSLPPAAFVFPVTSTQPVGWHAPMIATADMLLPPSTAPSAASGTGGMLHTPPVLKPGAVASSNPDQPESGPLSTAQSEVGTNASVPAPNQTRPSFVGPRRLSGTPEFTSHDLQKHIEESLTFLSNEKAPQPEEAGREAIGELSDRRKRSIPADEELSRKKAKRTPAPAPSSATWEAMQKTFDNLLSREAARSSTGGS